MPFLFPNKLVKNYKDKEALLIYSIYKFIIKYIKRYLTFLLFILLLKVVELVLLLKIVKLALLLKVVRFVSLLKIVELVFSKVKIKV